MRILKLQKIDPVWFKFGSYLSIIFFMYLSDAILSDFVPGFLEERLSSPLMMGIVMSTSSIAGIILDLLFAQLFKGVTVKKTLLLAIVGGASFVGFLYGVIYLPIVILMVGAMVSWGIYYEMFGFAAQQYVADIANSSQRPNVWAVLETFKGIAYALGPIVGGWLVLKGDTTLLNFAFMILGLSLLMFWLVKLKSKPIEIDIEEISLKKEIGHWMKLGKSVWPVLLMSFMLITLDAAFWTTGTIINDNLAKISSWGGLFVTLYMLPSLFVGFIIPKLGIHTHKKKYAQLFLIFGGLILATISIFPVVAWYLFVVALSSLFTAITFPLIDAVYTDLIVRMGRERKHMIGLCSSMNSLGYIVGPILAGWLSGLVGDINSFKYYGIVIAVVTTILLLVTPRKIKLPQSEISSWE